jgi:hypothetical protein
MNLLISEWAMGFKLKNGLLSLCQLSHPFALQTADCSIFLPSLSNVATSFHLNPN